MQIYRTKFEKLLKGVGILELLLGLLSALVLLTSLIKLSSGEYVLLLPLWQFVSTALILTVLQILMGVFAILYATSEKVRYCAYVGFTVMICIALDTFILHTSQETTIVSFLGSLLFPAFYTAIAINLQNFYKHS